MLWFILINRIKEVLMHFRLIRTLLITLVVLFCVSSLTFSKTTQSDEMKFQFGLGAFVSTSNILGLIEDVKMAQAIKDNDGTEYNFPGMTDSQREALGALNSGMQRAILIANILGGMQYGIHMRILWNVLIGEADLTLLPFEGSYNGRLDFSLTPMVGIRAPFFIMPYIMLGPSFTFSFYPANVADLESWRTNAVFKNFAFAPGLNTRVGLDLKLGKFAIGGYYQYSIVDFQEFGGWFWQLTQNFSASDAAARIFSSQSRFGGIITFYF
jgi:hypothetical protein